MNPDEIPETRTITMELSALDASAVICGLGLLTAMLGGEDAAPPDSVLRMMDEISIGDALRMTVKVQHAVEQQIVGL